MKQTLQGQQAAMDLDTAWHNEQLDDLHDRCDQLEEQNEFSRTENRFLRSELDKQGRTFDGRTFEGDEERTFALGGVPNGADSASSSDGPQDAFSIPTAPDDRWAAATGERAMDAAGLLAMVRESDAACGELQQMVDKLLGQLSAGSPRSSSSISPFARVAAGTKEEQSKATQLLCSEASRQAGEVRSRLASLIEALQGGDVESEPEQPIQEQPGRQPQPEPAWAQSVAVPQARNALAQQSVSQQTNLAKQSVSFLMLDQPAYSANLDSFMPGSRNRNHELTKMSFDHDTHYDTSQLDNPLFGATMSRERVPGTTGVALTRASVAAQMFSHMAEEDNNTELQEKLAQAMRQVQQQVRDGHVSHLC